MRPRAGRGLQCVRLVLALLALSVVMSCDPGRDSRGGDEASSKFGKAEFELSATGEAEESFIIGLLALHSFWYEEARDHFRAAQKHDPTFGMAYWGEAMTYDNAFSTSHSHDNEGRGEEVVRQMERLDAKGNLQWNELERGFADAVRQRFHADWDHNTRRQAYAEAMSQLSARYPHHDEVTAFTALAIMAVPGFDREDPAHVTAVASHLEEVYERSPDHPGVLHYLIHVYDTPTFAHRGLRAARRYAEIAPASSHALHMPGHIFRHLGMWEEVAASNEEAYEASVTWQEATKRPLHMRDFHALEWLLDSSLHLGQTSKASELIEELDAIETRIEQRDEPWGEFPESAERMRSYYERHHPEPPY